MHPLLAQDTPRILPLDLSQEYPKVGKIWLRALTMVEKTKYELGNRHKVFSEEWVHAEQTRASELVVLTVCDEQGTLQLQATDVIALQERDARLITIIHEVSCRWSGLTLPQSIFAAIEDAEKKSSTTGS